MALPRIRSLRGFVGALLILLPSGGSAAEPSARDAYRRARDAADRREWDAAQAIVDDALRRAGSGDDASVWMLRVLRGQILCGLGHFPEAQQVLAPELPPALRNSEPAVQRLIWLAVIASRGGDEAEVERILTRARVLAAAHQPQMLAEVYSVAGSVGPRADREANARTAWRLARQSGNVRVQVGAMNDILLRCIATQRYVEAIRWGEEALSLAKSHRLEVLVQKLEGNVGWAYYETGNVDTAETYFESALAAANRLGAVNDRVIWSTDLGNIRYKRADYGAAEQTYRSALELARRIRHPYVGPLLFNLAAVAMEQGRYAEARRLNVEAAAERKKANQPNGAVLTALLDGRIAAAEGKFDEAVALFARVTRESEVPSLRWRAKGHLAIVYAQANRVEQADAEFRAALAMASESRNSLTDELRLSFLNPVKFFFDAYVDFLLAGGRVADALAVTENARAQTLEEGLGMKSRGAVDAAAVATARNATILCYWLGHDHSYVWTIAPAAALRVTTLPAKAHIAAAVSTYRRGLLNIPMKQAVNGGRAEQLWQMLVEAATRGLPRDARVIVIPDESLHVLNFETLVVPRPKAHYWIEDVVLETAASLQLLAQPPKSGGNAPKILVVGNAPSTDPAFPPLQNASTEIEKVARHFPHRSTLLTGTRATPAAYAAAAPETFDYIHFVAHGVATLNHPLDSAVILARDANGDRLSARAIVARPLRARLVTISSCHSAGTRMFAGEGLVGLAWAFQRAGAERVIAALWEVNDKAAPELMDDMYARIGKGQDPPAALRAAKLRLVHGATVYRNPKYWAAFVLYAGS